MTTTHPRLESVDLTDLDLFADGFPHELFARMRADTPVRWNESTRTDGFWSITRADHIREVGENPARFSSAKGGVFLTRDTIAPLAAARSWVLFQDPPEHSKYRSLVAGAFLPRTMVILEDSIKGVVERTLGEVADRGECDYVHDVAEPIALRMVAQMMGASEEDVPRIQGWVAAIGDALTNDTSCFDELQEMGAHLASLVNKQIVRGVESLASSMAEAEIDGERLDEAGIALYFAALVWAGVYPMTHAIAGGMLAFMQHPDQLAEMRLHPGKLRLTRSGLTPPAIDEILRWTTPVNYLSRTATEDTSIGGTVIKAGDRVVMWFPAGNRDPEAFPNPDTFDTDRGRDRAQHLAFSAGPHTCQGAYLANQLLSKALTESIKRLPDIELAGEYGWERSIFFTALTTLPVRFQRR
jgi:cholest-4-en-3-one 26-monooxygenase